MGKTIPPFFKQRHRIAARRLGWVFCFDARIAISACLPAPAGTFFLILLNKPALRKAKSGSCFLRFLAWYDVEVNRAVAPTARSF
jgi:hypothetical protein